ncbi:MAG: hypothetical protein AAF721_23615 [Myxococcota bacterium]
MLVLSAFSVSLFIAAAPPSETTQAVGPIAPYEAVHARPVTPLPTRTRDEIDATRFRIGGGLVGAAGIAGLVTTATLQAAELRRPAQCPPTEEFRSGLAARTCIGSVQPAEAALRSGGLAGLVGAGFGAGYLLGRARGLDEAAAGKRYVRNWRALTVFSTFFAVTSANVLLLANVAGIRHERACETRECVVESRVRRYVATDLSASVLGFSLGVAAHTLGRSVELRRVKQLSLRPGATRAGASLSASGRF